MAVGYVLGTRAGREKYAQIVDNARRLRDNPTLGQAGQAVRDLAGAATSPPAAVADAVTAPPARRPTKNAVKKTGRTAVDVP
jgi:hypothetical protein